MKNRRISTENGSSPLKAFSVHCNRRHRNKRWIRFNQDEQNRKRNIRNLTKTGKQSKGKRHTLINTSCSDNQNGQRPWSATSVNLYRLPSTAGLRSQPMTWKSGPGSSMINGKSAGSYIVHFYFTWAIKELYTTCLIHTFTFFYV